ncbi:MAG: deoxyguanosinetriphosphate triphosphohydrolase [Acidobacteria bacterium]|nr:MAG: deoxyguanosinetriphosphate triphosphohydrolase [Acidobacteriota bacterium]
MTDPGFLHLTRETREEDERRRLAPLATRAAASRGRERPEADDPIRTAFERDRDRIYHSKAFRRLKHKTQVFINPEGDHFVTRLTHTLQVTQIGRSLAVALGLNEPLTEAICLGHEVGHPPFGHTGEVALSPYVEGEWLHSEQSVRVLSVLEPLNLTWEVLDGIRAHTWKVDPGPATPEGMLCRYADRIAYLVHDMEDAIRAGVLAPSDLPAGALEAFGKPGREWVGRMIHAVIDESLRRGEVAMEPSCLAAMHRFRDFMFERVYLRPEARRQSRKAVKLLRDLVDHFLDHPDQLPDSYRHKASPVRTQVLDFVAGMTDRYALKVHDELFRPLGMV